MNRPQPKKVVRPAGLTPRLVGAPVEPEPPVPETTPTPVLNPTKVEYVNPETGTMYVINPKTGNLEPRKFEPEFTVTKSEPKRKIPESFRQTLLLNPSDIIDFFDVQIGEKQEFIQVDFVVPKETLEHRIAQLKKVIACSKQIIEGMDSWIIKIRRGKDDPLLDDKIAREKYKRDENARIARSNSKLFRYRAALRSGNYHEQVWRMVTKPIYFRDVVDDIRVETVVDITYTEIDEVKTIRYDHMDLNAYEDIMKLGFDALNQLGSTEQDMRARWEDVRQWENLVIKAAVRYGIIRPRRDLAELLGLGSILDEDGGPIDLDETENVLAIKTGGACYSGRIKTEGGRRMLTSFDKPIRDFRNGGSIKYKDMGFGSLKNIEDDTESYDPR